MHGRRFFLWYGIHPRFHTGAPDHAISVLLSNEPRNTRGNHKHRSINLEAIFLLTRRGEAQGALFACCLDILISYAVRVYLDPICAYFQLDIRKSSGFKGYQPLLSSNNDPENMGDMHEGYEVGWETLDPTSDNSDASNHGVMTGANVWPNEVPEFRDAVLQY